MELLAALRNRHSTRLFKNQPVSDDEIRELCDAAALAPSSMNSQPWHFYVATGDSRDTVGKIMSQTTLHLQEYIEVLGAEGVEHAARFYEDLGMAPVIIAVTAPVLSEPAEQRDAFIAVGAAVENFLLLAIDRGLGACNISAPKWVVDQLMDAFGVPETSVIASLIIVGHPDEAPLTKERHHDVVTFVSG